MTLVGRIAVGFAALCIFTFDAGTANANDYREKGKTVEIVGSKVIVTPTRDWNRLDYEPGKYAETWTLDGDQLNDVTFYCGVEPGRPLVKERDKKRQPLPKLSANALLIEIPELLENTHRASKQSGRFALTSSKPGRFLARDGVEFTYEYTDQDELVRKGEARAVLIGKRLCMVAFEAPRLHFFDKSLADFRALADSARLRR